MVFAVPVYVLVVISLFFFPPKFYFTLIVYFYGLFKAYTSLCVFLSLNWARDNNSLGGGIVGCVTPAAQIALT